MRKYSTRGVNGVEFVKYVEDVEVRTEEKSIRYVIEHRVDPLTKHVTRISPSRARREAEIAEPRELGDGSTCPFCSPRVLRVTPLPRILRGYSAAFPNLHPFSAHHIVVVPNTSTHVVKLDELSAEDLANSLRLAFDYFKGNYSRDPSLKFAYVNMNFLPSAGASQYHLHFQVFQTSRPTTFHKELLARSMRYRRKFGTNYWDDIVKSEEELGERFIGWTGPCATIASFSPLLNGEVLCVFSSDLLAESGYEFLAEVLSKLLRAYGTAFPYHGMNMTIFDTVFYRKSSAYFRPHLRLVARKRLTEFYTNDVGFMELIHREPVVVVVPEKLAVDLKSSLRP